MRKRKLFNLYEKLYFHEVEAREKISIRLQFPLVILLSIISVFAHIINGISFYNTDLWSVIFWITFFVSIIFFITSLIYFIISFYGHTYTFIPSAKKTEEYRQELIETYRKFENHDSLVDQYFDEYLFNYYNDCSSKNTIVNDKRSKYLHHCNTFLILSALPLMATFLIFTLAGIDKNTIDKEYKVKITSPINIDQNIIPIQANEKPLQPILPEPSPPPPVRTVIEDVEIHQRPLSLN